MEYQPFLPAGAETSMWDPSIAPAHWMMPHFSLKPSMTSVSWLQQENTNILENTVFMALHVSCTMMHTVHLATPRRWPTVLYSHGVARHQCHCNTMLETDGSSHFCVFLFNMWSQLCTDKEEGIFADSKISEPV